MASSCEFRDKHSNRPVSASDAVRSVVRLNTAHGEAAPDGTAPERPDSPPAILSDSATRPMGRERGRLRPGPRAWLGDVSRSAVDLTCRRVERMAPAGRLTIV
jgi:hypothetical protein